MAATKKGGGKSNRKGRRRSSFLCSFAACFGISSKVSTDHADKKWLSGRQPPVNDQHIPALTSDIVKSTKEIHVVEDDGDHKEKTIPPTDELMNNKRNDDVVMSEKSKNREESNPNPIIIKQSGNANDTWTNRRKLSHSVSLPAPNQKREKPAAEGKRRKGEVAAEGKRGKGEVAAVGGELDSTVGAVMISVTLVVMIIWGKICAVVCTAAWFYFVPRFRAKMEKSYATAMELRNGESDGVDLDSWESKKKVVLQGLLHRNHNL